MNRARVSFAVAGSAASAALGAAVWPHARDADAVLAAQDDPAALADLRVNSALRNNLDVDLRQCRGRHSRPMTPISPQLVALARDEERRAR